MRIGVVGAGFYGCHLARHLLRQGHDVVIFEQKSIFAGASGNNQDRVHLGFHYPRSAKTRTEIKYCYKRFVEEYPTVPVSDNLYAVATASLIDFPTYTAICRSAGLEFQEVDPHEFGLLGVERAIRTKERVVDTPATIKMFQRDISAYIRYESVGQFEKCRSGVVINDDPFDAALNCTNLRLPDVAIPVYYEAAMILTARGPVRHPSFTVMDGQFPALLATPSATEYTLSHVTHTALAKCDSFEEAQEVLDRTRWENEAEKFVTAESVFYPEFRSRFEITGARAAVRTKPINGTDSRECLTAARDRVMTVVCGKFMSVFIATERVDEWLQSLSGTPDSSVLT